MKRIAAVAVTYMGLMIGLIALVGDPPLKTWVAYIVVLSVLMGGIFLLVAHPRHVARRFVPLLLFFVCVSLFLDYLYSVVSLKAEFLDQEFFVYGLDIIMCFIVALLYAATLKIAGRFANHI